jgi:hypothetical protein
MEQLDRHTKLLSQSLNGKYHLVDISLDGRIILRWTLAIQFVKRWAGLTWVRMRPSGWTP